MLSNSPQSRTSTRLRGVYGRADLVAALAAGEFALARTLAEFAGFERSPLSKDNEVAGQPSPEPDRIEPPREVIVPRPLADTPFWLPVRYESLADDGIDAPPSTTTPLYTGWTTRPTHTPPMPPLTDWRELEPRLRRLLCLPQQSRAIDLELTVRQISRGRYLADLPRERRRRWGPALRIIEDNSRRLIPFRLDRFRVLEGLRRLLPAQALSRGVFRDGMTRPQPIGSAGTRVEPIPPPGTVVLVLGDLGSLAVARHDRCESWLRYGRDLRAAGCLPVALFPGPLERCPARLACVWHLIPWERPRPRDPSDTPAARANRLLRLVSPAVRIEPGLLRAARQLLASSEADAGTEADVWQHPDLISRSAAGATLNPERARQLRAEFADRFAPGLQARFALLLRAWRGYLPEEIWFEELLNLPPDARSGAGIEQDLFCARRYFADFVHLGDGGDAVTGTDREWFARVERRALPALWGDAQVGDDLKRLSYALHAQDPGYRPPPGFEPGLIRRPDKPIQRIAVCQHGRLLELTRAGGDTPVPGPGSPLAALTSRNGLVQIEDAVVEDDSPAEPPVKTVETPGARSSEPTLLHLENTLEKQTSDLQSARFLVRTDRGCLTFRRIVKPAWASAIGRDRFGLWTEITVEREKAGPVSQRLRWIPPGTFAMGSSPDEPGSDEGEGPQHHVLIGDGFWLFDTACSQALWEAVMGKNPSRFISPERPVEEVSWESVQDFLRRIDERVPGLALVLPSEAQWEYACRAGTATPFSFGETITPEQVNYDGNHPYVGERKGRYRAKTVPVRSLPPNPWGLYEMHGNIGEWVQDNWHDSYEGAPADGSPWVDTTPGAGRVVRGGSWDGDARYVRSACRNQGPPDGRYGDLGFRCARVQL